jgi:uncharacterized protein YbjT (DUF2867 family)
MIFLTGGTGTVGSALLTRLGRSGVAARAAAHSPAGRSLIQGYGAQAVDGDFDRPETLHQAMVGCDHLFLLSPAHPEQPAREKATIDAAVQAGIAHVVAVSVIGADPASQLAFSRWHADVDEHLISSGLDYTILRPSGFMQSHLLPVDTVKAQGRWYGMTGDGAAGFIDAEDIAAVAAEALTSQGHSGAIYELTGPAAISMPQAAAELSEVLGRGVEYVDLPADGVRAGLLGAGLPDFVADSLSLMYQGIRDGHGATVTNTVEQVTGRPARSYHQFAEAHQDAFTGG